MQHTFGAEVEALKRLSSLKYRISESEFQDQVITMAELLGWAIYHVDDVRGRLRSKTSVGFPDLCLARRRLLFRELKVGRNKPTKPQEEWLRILVEAGQDAGIWRPTDWPRIEAELKREF